MFYVQFTTIFPFITAIDLSAAAFCFSKTVQTKDFISNFSPGMPRQPVDLRSFPNPKRHGVLI
jgi:hypothetical protein